MEPRWGDPEPGGSRSAGSIGGGAEDADENREGLALSEDLRRAGDCGDLPAA